MPPPGEPLAANLAFHILFTCLTSESIIPEAPSKSTAHRGLPGAGGPVGPRPGEPRPVHEIPRCRGASPPGPDRDPGPPFPGDRFFA